MTLQDILDEWGWDSNGFDECDMRGLLKKDVIEYANQRVIEELEKLHIYPDVNALNHGFKGDGYVKENDIESRIKELKK